MRGALAGTWLGALSIVLLLVLATPAWAQGPDTAAAGVDPSVAAIRFYQQYLSSLRHGHCRFTPSCSEYAAEAIGRYGVVEGSALAADRLMRCNVSATRFYPQGANGLLEDPPDGGPTSTSVRVPRWLFVAPESAGPPLPTGLDIGRRARIDESVAFAVRLSERGDCERAATEYQRVGSLAGSPVTDAWAFARIGECQLAVSQWSAAERAFLTAGMLSPTPSGRARAVYRAAVSRFDAGAFTACERLLADPSLAVPVDTGGDTASATASRDPVVDLVSDAGGPAAGAGFAAVVSPDRVKALGGLCAMALGDWSDASADFTQGSALAGDPERRTRILGLLPYAERGPGLPHRSPGLAGTLSAVIPGSGQMYCGRTRDGFRHLFFNGVLIWSVVSLATRQHVPAAILVAGIELPFYLGNIKGASRAARDHDRLQRMDLLQRAIHDTAR